MREFPYTLALHIEVDGYGTIEQATQTAQRVERELELLFHRPVSIKKVLIRTRENEVTS